MTITEKIFALKSSPPFDKLKDSEIILIAEIVRERHYTAGRLLTGGENPLKNLYITVEGGVFHSGGRSLPPVIGMASLLFSRVTGPLKASQDKGARCLVISKGQFFTIINECPNLLLRYLELINGDPSWII